MALHTKTGFTGTKMRIDLEVAGELWQAFVFANVGTRRFYVSAIKQAATSGEDPNNWVDRALVTELNARPEVPDGVEMLGHLNRILESAVRRNRQVVATRIVEDPEHLAYTPVYAEVVTHGASSNGNTLSLEDMLAASNGSGLDLDLGSDIL